jgi:hypothetical protein
MKLYIFRSGAAKELRAFTGDITGSKLPEQFRPWQAIGAVGAERAPPHKLSRGDIEESINSRGFQLWRLKPATTDA